MKNRYWLLILIIMLVMCISPLAASGYIVSFLNILLVYVSLTIAFNILTGNTGYVNLGHAAFFGVGAYAFGKVYSPGIGVVFAFVIAALVAVVLSILVSYPLFRLRGSYFAIASMGFVLLMNRLAYNLEFITKGFMGLQIMAGDVLIQSYYVLLAITITVFLVSYRISKTKLGFTLRAIKGDEELARTLGINTYKYKTITLMISSLFAGLTGATFMWYNSYINPETGFGILLIFLPPTMAMLGGVGTLIGPIIGATALTVLIEVLWNTISSLQLVAEGVILVLIALIMPGGILKTASGIRRRFIRPAKFT